MLSKIALQLFLSPLLYFFFSTLPKWKFLKSKLQIIFLVQWCVRITELEYSCLNSRFVTYQHCNLDGETVETVSDFIFLGSKITADGDCIHEIKRCLLLGRKVMTNLDSIFKSRDITLPTKVRLVKAMVFPVVMYGCRIGL